MDVPSTPTRRRSSWGERIAFFLLVVVPFLVIASCVIWGHYGVAGIG